MYPLLPSHRMAVGWATVTSSISVVMLFEVTVRRPLLQPVSTRATSVLRSLLLTGQVEVLAEWLDLGGAGHRLGRLVERDRVFLAKDLEDGLAFLLDALSA